jgi:hypothetical protein
MITKVFVIVTLISGVASNLLGQPASMAELNSRHFMVMGVTLGVSTFHDVELVFGARQQKRQCGNDTADDEGICFVSKRDGTRVVFKASLSSFDGELDGIEVGNRVAPGSCYNACMRTAFPRQPVTAGGLRLGLTQVQVLALLGRPNTSDVNTFYYTRTHQQLMTQADIQKWLQSENPPTEERISKGNLKLEIVDSIQVFFNNSHRVVGFFVGHSRY